MDILPGTYTILEWMQIIGLGAVVGAAGQCIRSIAGLRKLNDYAGATNASARELFSTSQLAISLLIGAVAGVLGAISLGISPSGKIPAQTIVTLLGVGYAGADFIEAFMQKHGAELGGVMTPGKTATKPDGANLKGAASSGAAVAPKVEAVG